MLSKPGRIVEIYGVPVFCGHVLTPNDPIFQQLESLEEYCDFARRIRGTFALVIRESAKITAVTDFGGCFPVYYVRDTVTHTYQVSSLLGNLRPYCSGKVSPRALFFFACRGGIALDPLYFEVEAVYPARVIQFAGVTITSSSYLDWGEFLEERPITPRGAQERFLEIACGYVGAVARSQERVGCLLSGGTDSALISWLVQRTGKELVCLTADYRLKWYSEMESAKAAAAKLKLRHERVWIRAGDHRQAFLKMNSCGSDVPTHNAQASRLYGLAEYAHHRGIRCLFHGDNADALFLGFDNLFTGFATTAEYQKQFEHLDRGEKMRALIAGFPLPEEGKKILLALGCSVRDYEQWAEEMTAFDRNIHARWIDKCSLPLLRQLGGQMWVGVSLQNSFLPPQRAAATDVELVSPFLDLEMVKFALSLPLRFKFRDGTAKPIIRDVLEAQTGIRVSKRASPNPRRWWNLMPSASMIARVDPRLRSLLVRQMARNLPIAGHYSAQMSMTSALGVWLRSHKMGGTAPFSMRMPGALKE